MLVIPAAQNATISTTLLFAKSSRALNALPTYELCFLLRATLCAILCASPFIYYRTQFDSIAQNMYVFYWLIL